MAHVVSGKLRKAPFIKPGLGQDGQSTMYAIELSEMVKDYKSDEKYYTNYKAMFFAKTQGANDFYSKAFAEGSFVSVACEKLKTDIFNADNGQTYVTMIMENARLEGCMPAIEMGGGQQQQGGWGQPQQPQQQQAPQQQYNEPPKDFDNDIPF